MTSESKKTKTSKSNIEPQKREKPYTLEDDTRSEGTQRVIERKTKKLVGTIADMSKFYPDGPSFKIEWNEPYHHLNRMFVPKLESIDKAASFLYNVYFAANSCREQIPINDLTLYTIKELARSLRQEIQTAKDVARAVYYKRSSLQYLAKQLGIEGMIWELEDDEDVTKILEFKLSGADTPFFSEGVLYDLVGKEDARTILALLKNLVSKIDIIQEHDV